MKSHAEKEGGSVGCEAERPGGSTRPNEGEGSLPENTPPEDIHLQLRELFQPLRDGDGMARGSWLFFDYIANLGAAWIM